MSNLNNQNRSNYVDELGNLFLSVTGGGVFYVGTASQTSAMADGAAGVATTG
jgi:hypothetical protein